MSVEKVLAEAEKTLGWSDKNNTSKTPVHVWYEQKFGDPDPSKYAWDWCDGWVTYVAHHAGDERAMRCSSGMVDTQRHAAAFRANGEWTTGAVGIRKGDVVFFNWGDGIEHVGIALGPVADGKFPTIEGNTLNAVAKRLRKVSDVAGYGRPKYTTPAPAKPAPKLPAPTPEVPSVDVIFEDLGPNGTAAANKVVQAALNKFKAPVAVDGVYGPQTKAAYKAWQEHLGFTGSDADGLPGWTSATRLAAAYGFHLIHRPTGPSTGGTPAMSGYLTMPEPAHSYSRVTYGGKTVNVRTREMLRLAATWAGVTITLTQGSYNRGVGASAGTHDGGGVVDLDVNAWSNSRRAAVVQALRKAGFAAWLRTPADGFAYHIHACAIGDREMAAGAKSQVQAYFNGRNGLANNRSDSVERHWPNWADKYNQ